MLSSNTSGVSEDANYIESVFSTYLYTGTGSSLPIVNNIDLATKGGLTWIKQRSSTEDHWLTSTANTVSQYLGTAETDGYRTSTGSFTSFNADGFTLGSGGSAVGRVNTSGATYASWTFRKQPKFFDIVTYTGTGSARTVAHSLGSTPGCIIVKKTSGVDDWSVYHRSLGATKFTSLNTTAAPVTNSTRWNDTAPTATDFTVGTSASTNQSGQTYVAYLFAHDAGGFGLTGTDNVISCGSYAGTGAAGNSVTLGYEPQWILLKETTTAGVGWYLQDVMRGLPTGGNSLYLQPNTSAAETGAAPYIDVTSTGFQLTTGINAYNGAGRSYIYIAIRRGPMKVPTDATKVYAPVLAPASGPGYVTNFPVDMGIHRARGAGSTYTSSRLLSKTQLSTNTTDAEGASSDYVFDYSNGWYLSSPAGFASWAFRRAPSFFDEVCYTGTGTNGQTYSHNLGVAPELMIVKRRNNSGQWFTYSNFLGATKFLQLQGIDASATSSAYWNDTAPTSSVFTVGNSSGVNLSTNTYVAYLFATCAGVSKVGSYTGTGTTKQVDCGFAAGARFVLIKRTDSTGDWYVWDTARGIVSGNDPYLLLNSTAAEVTTTDYIDTYSAGFELSSTAPAALNASGGTYIFLAIA